MLLQPTEKNPNITASAKNPTQRQKICSLLIFYIFLSLAGYS